MKKSNERESTREQVEKFEPLGDGMGDFMAKYTIRREMKNKLIMEYNIVELTNHGRYFYALVETKDGQWRHQLLLDKQSGGVQEVAAKKIGC